MSSAGHGREHAQMRARVMLIEDHDDSRELLETLLRNSGYDTCSFSRADVALRMLDQECPDIIVLDLTMPGMNGWQFRAEQKKHATRNEIPVVVLTADMSAYAAAIDAAAHLAKPVDIRELARVIERILLTQERRRLVARAMELERVHSLGMLVASVAHEINNPLTYVLGCLDLARNDMHALAEAAHTPTAVMAQLRSNLDAAFDGAERVAATVRLISTFARADGDALRGRVDVTRTVKAATRLAQQQIEPWAKLNLELASVPEAVGNEARLAQVLLNLLVNAAHAIPKDGQRAHEVRVRTAVHDDHLTIEVRDTGPGIADEHIDSIFEPFFTTKPPGQGTGLGLSISRDIVTEMGGTLSAENAEGGGATFRVRLPIAEPVARVSAAGQPETSSLGRAEANARLRVWVIDDEPLIGKFVEAALPGENVTLVNDPCDALVRADALDADIILCDLRMPEMSGIALFHGLMAKRPELRAAFVLMSGASADAELETFLHTECVPVLRKPFSLRALRDFVAARRARLERT